MLTRTLKQRRLGTHFYFTLFRGAEQTGGPLYRIALVPDCILSVIGYGVEVLYNKKLMERTMTSGGNNKDIIQKLDKILEAELSGVVRYLHYSFMIFGPNRIPITQWFRNHATEGMTHAVLIGEKITALGGHPSIKVQPVPESNEHNVLEILKESLQFEKETIQMYHGLLEVVKHDIALEEMVRKLIAEEVGHIEEVEKMCRTQKV